MCKVVTKSVPTPEPAKQAEVLVLPTPDKTTEPSTFELNSDFFSQEEPLLEVAYEEAPDTFVNDKFVVFDV
jgi:hypothetical protein